MTFCVTCVVDKTLKTHFRNCSRGRASFVNGVIEALGISALLMSSMG